MAPLDAPPPVGRLPAGEVNGAGPGIREIAGDALDAQTLHELLRLRVDVFVVEQRCPYPELDGRDLEPTTRHLYVTEGGRPVACVRLVAEPDGGTRLGRVATAESARGRGLAAALVRRALAVAGRPVVCHAQAHLAGWYTRLGFRQTGPEFDEDGIPHVPMRQD